MVAPTRKVRWALRRTRDPRPERPAHTQLAQLPRDVVDESSLIMLHERGVDTGTWAAKSRQPATRPSCDSSARALPLVIGFPFPRRRLDAHQQRTAPAGHALLPRSLQQRWRDDHR